MSSVDRLLRRKDRLTRRLMAKSFRAGAHRPRPKATWLRSQIYRVDLLLEREGYFD